MALINHAKREINAKIVYYGREGAGKRSSLQYIYDRIKPTLRGELRSPSASGDSLFFFDFCPFENTVFGDYRIRFHVYTLPGKVSNPAAWKMTLKGADGLVIVADASAELAAAERENIQVLRGFLAAYGVGLHDIPCVLQLNKGNSPHNTSVTGMSAALELPDIPVCLSQPARGEGVLESLSLLSREIMARIGRDDALRASDNELKHVEMDDAEVSAVLPSREEDVYESAHASVPGIEEKSMGTAGSSEDDGKQFQVVMAGEGASFSGGIVRVPLEFTHAGSTCRLVLSIAIDQV